MKIGCIASHRSAKSTELLEFIAYKYSDIALYDKIASLSDHDCDILIALGGDGFVLRVLHKLLQLNKHEQTSIYGINCGNIGFLLNDFDSETEDLMCKIKNASKIELSPLKIIIDDASKNGHKIYAINEISLIRQTYQAVNIEISVEDTVKIEHLIGDGVLLSTEAGSAAYNLSAGGAILPLGAGLMTMTPINPFRPRGWKGAILRDTSKIEFKILEDIKRPVLACADFHQFYFVKRISVFLDKGCKYSLLFDDNTSLSKKIMDEQFIHW